MYEYLTESNLNDNFWKWFGDSKVVDDKGNPLVVYHGTDKILDRFDFKMIGSNTGNFGHYGYGIYFSDDLREAKTYGKIIYKCYLNIRKPFYGTTNQIIELKNQGVHGIDDLVPKSIDFDSLKESFRNNRIVYKFLNDVELKNEEYAWDNIHINKYPIDDDVLTMLNEISNNILEHTTLFDNHYEVPEYVIELLESWNIHPKMNIGFSIDQSLHWITNLGMYSEEVTEVIKKLGYDGVYYGSEIIPFSPTQIKSIDNEGTWNPNVPNIYK